MGTVIGATTYYDGYGNKVTKERFDLLWEKFYMEVEKAYNDRVNIILDKINKYAFNDAAKLKLLFNYFTSDKMKYDLTGVTQDGKMAIDRGYAFPPYTNWRLGQGTKHPAILYNSGVCITFSLAFQDMARRLGIPCEVVNGFTTMEHSWNAVLIDGEVKYVDIAFALMDRNNKNRYCLCDSASLGSRRFYTSPSEIETKLKQSNAVFDNEPSFRR